MLHRVMTAAAVLTTALSAPAAGAEVDFSNPEQTLKKQPAYRSKAPMYGLIALGADAATRIWLVRDGATVYIDLNANGDLTDPGEAVKNDKSQTSDYVPFAAGVPNVTEADGKTRHGALTVRFYDDEKTRAYLRIELHNGITQWANMVLTADPKDAPVAHFNGPWQFGYYPDVELRHGDDDLKLYLMIGTPGVNSFASVSYATLGDEVKPIVHIDYPPARNGAEPVRQTLILPGRC